MEPKIKIVPVMDRKYPPLIKKLSQLSFANANSLNKTTVMLPKYPKESATYMMKPTVLVYLNAAINRSKKILLNGI